MTIDTNTNDDDDTTREQDTGPWVVCLCLVDRTYGGPEEGGWYYTCGEPVLTEDLVVFNTYELAREYAAQMRHVEDDMNVGRPSIGSVLSEGRYEFHVVQGWPKRFPETRPRYE